MREVEGLVMRRGGGGRRDQDGVLARDGEELVCRQIAVDVGGCWLCGGFVVLRGQDRVQAPKRDGIRAGGRRAQEACLINMI